MASNGVFFIDPLSVAADGFDLFDQYSNQLSLATLGFIKFKITKVTRKKRGGNEQQFATPPIEGWKIREEQERRLAEEKKAAQKHLEAEIDVDAVEIIQPVPDLETIKELLKSAETESIEITLEPINDSIQVYIEPIQEVFEKIFQDVTISVEFQSDENINSNEVNVTLHKTKNAK